MAEILVVVRERESSSPPSHGMMGRDHGSKRFDYRIMLHTANGVPRGVFDVAWAPNVGRSYHLIATCGKDHRLKVHRAKKRGRGGGGKGGGGGEGVLLRRRRQRHRLWCMKGQRIWIEVRFGDVSGI